MAQAASTTKSGEQSEVVGIGGNWSGDFGGASVSVGGGYTMASAEAPGDGVEDRNEWIAGASASMDAITVGGNYSEDNNGGGDGPHHVGGRPELQRLRSGDVRRPLCGHDRRREGRVCGLRRLQLAYRLRPQCRGELQFWDVETSDGTPNSATVGIIGTTVRF